MYVYLKEKKRKQNKSWLLMQFDQWINNKSRFAVVNLLLFETLKNIMVSLLSLVSKCKTNNGLMSLLKKWIFVKFLPFYYR